MKKIQWIDRKQEEIPEYDWIILGFDVDDNSELPNFAWQIGRRIGNKIEFWGQETGAGPYQGDAFWTWKPEQSTHWLEFNPYEIEIHQPERSKREDLERGCGALNIAENAVRTK